MNTLVFEEHHPSIAQCKTHTFSVTYLVMVHFKITGESRDGRNKLYFIVERDNLFFRDFTHFERLNLLNATWFFSYNNINCYKDGKTMMTWEGRS